MKLMKKKIFALAVAAMAVLGAQAQTSVYTWDEDFIKNIKLSCNPTMATKTETNNSRDGISISQVYDPEVDGTRLKRASLWNGSMAFADPESGVYFTTGTGAFTKIVITYTSGDNINSIAFHNWVNNDSVPEKTLTWSGYENKVFLGRARFDSDEEVRIVQIKQIDFTIVGVENYIISSVPSGWTVNDQLPANGKVKIAKGSAVVVKPANIPAGKKIKSIKFVREE